MPPSLKQDLVRLRIKKREAEELGRRKKYADAEFKQHQARVFERMQADDIDSMKTAGTLFSVVEKVRAAVDDRREYVRWAIANDYEFQQVLSILLRIVDEGKMISEGVQLYELLMDMMTSLELVEYKEKSDALNQLVRVAIDDGNPLPPGATFRPDNYISQRSA